MKSISILLKGKTEVEIKRDLLLKSKDELCNIIIELHERPDFELLKKLAIFENDYIIDQLNKIKNDNQNELGVDAFIDFICDHSIDYLEGYYQCYLNMQKSDYKEENDDELKEAKLNLFFHPNTYIGFFKDLTREK